MSMQLQKLALLCPALFGLAVLSPNSAFATETTHQTQSTSELNLVPSEIEESFPQENLKPSSDLVLADANAPTPSVSELMSDTENDGLEQVTSVSQLSDVQPDDWAFQAIQSLVERYGCVAGYPDGTFRPSRAMSRREAAALVNACLDNLSNRFATKEDLDALKALQDEFAAELATLRGRVDGLEARVATVEAQQFSTTTKLKGEVIFGAGYVSDRGQGAGEGDATGPGGTFEEDRVFLAPRVRLNFDTSFSGTDRLRTRFDINNVPDLSDSTNTRMSRLSFDGRGNTNVVLTELNYQFKPLDNLKVKIDANAGEYQDNVDTLNPYLQSSGSGALSRFGRFNPIYRQGSGGVGATVVWDIAEKASLSVGYLADEGENATGAGEDIAAPTGGFFGGSYAALAQLTVEPVEKIKVGLTYVRSFDEAGNVNVTSSTTNDTQRRPFGNALDTSADHLGFQTTIQPAEWVNFSGWVGYTFARTSNNVDNQSAELLNWAASLQFPDLGTEGSLGYVLFGQPFEIVSTNGGFVDPDNAATPYHIEAGYKFAVNDNIHITPGVIWILNPEHSATADDVVVGVIRTTFQF
ncbi:iron uptake porin [Acaryochloris sp. IP29b_bin.148]|uniref:iron uptake porin n=1 Tax=Acaryochloris sp. IP29b_bin.148 TaxID=2969218 RepID=UPI00262DF1C4|nr:iron uptake porin [Acaryochloris sp. IP29b_bin.148]